MNCFLGVLCTELSVSVDGTLSFLKSFKHNLVLPFCPLSESSTILSFPLISTLPPFCLVVLHSINHRCPTALSCLFVLSFSLLAFRPSANYFLLLSLFFLSLLPFLLLSFVITFLPIPKSQQIPLLLFLPFSLNHSNSFRLVHPLQADAPL